jgi:hypothetical protein
MGPLIPILVELFANLFLSKACGKSTSAEQPDQTPQEVLNAHYDSTAQRYDRPFLRQATRASVQHCRENGIPVGGLRNIRAQTIAALETARTATPEAVSAVMANINSDTVAACCASANTQTVQAAFSTAMNDDDDDLQADHPLKEHPPE